MIQRDYILRMIADLAEFLAKLLGLSKDHLPEAFEQAAQKVEDLYGMAFADFLSLDPAKLIKEDWPLHSGIADKLGEYLFEMGKMAGNLDQLDTREQLLLKSLYLLEQAEAANRSYSFDRVVTIGQIKEMLGV